MEHGEQFVLVVGVQVMRMWLVDHLGMIQELVCSCMFMFIKQGWIDLFSLQLRHCYQISLEKQMVLLCLIMLIAKDMRAVWLSAPSNNTHL